MSGRVPEIKNTQNIYFFEQCNKKNILITSVITLVALGAIAFGIWALTASLSGNLVVTSSINWQMGVGFIAGGVAIEIAWAIFWGVRNHLLKNTPESSSKQTAPESEKQAPQTPVKQTAPASVKKAPQTPLRTTNTTKKSSSTQQTQVQPPPKSAMNVVAMDRLIREIYGEDPPRSPKRPEELEVFLLKDEEILQLPLKKIQAYSSAQRDIIHDRLWRIEKKKIPPVMPAAPKIAVIEDGTLGDLRNIDGGTLAEHINRIPVACRGMLTANQLTSILRSNKIHLSARDLSELLPVQGNHKDAYTYVRFRQLQMNHLTPYLAQLSFEHLRLLPTEYCQLPEFPWEKACISKKNFSEFFEDSSSYKWETPPYGGDLIEARLEYVPMDLIKKHAALFSLESLQFFENRLTDPQFPWREFIQKKGIGNSLRTFKSDFLLRTSLPWDRLADYPEELEDVFESGKSKGLNDAEWSDKVNKTILPQLPDPTQKKICAALEIKNIQELWS